jgi:hypothetical protein
LGIRVDLVGALELLVHSVAGGVCVAAAQVRLVL